jgi:drug/metabolite transporter (DMT)-like permease
VSLKIWLGLSICNLIWSVHPILGKWLLDEFSPSQVAWLRYATALIGYLGVGSALRLFSKTLKFNDPLFVVPRRGRDQALIVLLGFLPFCFSPLIQLQGLSTSLASENAIIVAIEPILTAFLAWILLKEVISAWGLAAFGVAIFGFCLLAGLTPQTFQSGFGARGEGNLLILASLLGECSYTILARDLTRRYSPLGIFGSALLLGVVFLSVAIFGGVGHFQVPGVHQFTWKAVIALLWLGPLGTAAGYLYFMFALSDVPVMNVTLFLFLQPLAGALWGYLFAGDRLTLIQGFGSAMILLAVLLPYGSRLMRSILSEMSLKSKIS